MEKIQVRNARIEDAEYISLLARFTFSETFGQYFRDKQDLLDYYDRTFSVAKFRLSLEKENNVFWLAFHDGLPVGYAKLKKYSPSEFIHSDKTSQLQKLYVLQDFISQKVGFMLQHKMLEETKRIQNKYIWLSVLKSNGRAISFYTKAGFIPIGEHAYNIGKEHFEFFVMKKEL